MDERRRDKEQRPGGWRTGKTWKKICEMEWEKRGRIKEMPSRGKANHENVEKNSRNQIGERRRDKGRRPGGRRNVEPLKKMTEIKWEKGGQVYPKP